MAYEVRLYSDYTLISWYICDLSVVSSMKLAFDTGAPLSWGTQIRVGDWQLFTLAMVMNYSFPRGIPYCRRLDILEMNDHDLHLVDRDALGLRMGDRLPFDRGDGDRYISAALHRLRFLCNPPWVTRPYAPISWHCFGLGHTVFLQNSQTGYWIRCRLSPGFAFRIALVLIDANLFLPAVH